MSKGSRSIYCALQLDSVYQYLHSLWQVDDLRQQVRVLQAVGYNAMEADDGMSNSNGDAADSSRGAKAGQPGTLETLLLDKNRHMEHELTMARLKVADLTGALSWTFLVW